MIEEEDIELATRTQRTLEFIYSTIKENGEISQFKEDVMYVINELLNRLSKEKQCLTATEIVNRQFQAIIQKEKERHLENLIQKQQAEIEDYKKQMTEAGETGELVYQYGVPIMTEKDYKYVDDNFENIMKSLSNFHFLKKDMAMLQYIIQKQQEKISLLKEQKEYVINEYERTIEEKNKQIDLMAECIEELNPTVPVKENGGESFIKWCFYNKDKWKQYFKRKAEEV